MNSAILVDRLFTNKQKFVFWIFVYYHLHDVLGLRNDRISVEVSGGVELEIELLLPVTFALGEDVCAENIRVST